MNRKTVLPLIAWVAALLGVSAAGYAAGPVYWDWPQGRSFAELERLGFGLDRHGHLMRGLDSQEIGPDGPEVIWHLGLSGQGGVLAGTGHGGDLYLIDEKGRSSLRTQLPGEEIFTTLPLPGGGLLVGCGPEGNLYRVDGEGSASLLGKVAGGYVWDLAAQPGSDRVWVAAGSPGALYLWSADEGLTRVHDLNTQNCLALHFQDDGRLLVGTQGPGLVYRLDPQRPEKLEVLFQADQDEVRQFIVGPGGQTFLLALNSGEDLSSENRGNGAKNGQSQVSLLAFMDASSAPTVDRSALYRIDDQGRVHAHWASDLDLMIAAYSADYGWLAGGPLGQETEKSVLHGLDVPGGHREWANWPGGDILDILVLPGDSAGDRIMVAQAHPGGITQLGRLDEGMAEAVSPPLDGKQIVDWGRLIFAAEQQSKDLRWSVRTGNAETPDQTWSSWVSAWKGADQRLEVPAGRFLQWRVQAPRDAGDDFRVRQVSVSGWLENSPPQIKRLELEKVSDISLGGMLNGNDNVTQTFQSGLRAEFGRSSQADRRATGSRAAVTRPIRVFTWQGEDPDGDRLTYSLEYRRQGDQVWREIVNETQETIGAWDTSDVPDGQYLVRVRATDHLDNPGELSLAAQLETGPVRVDNTPPVITDFKLKRTESGFRVSLRVRDEASALAQASITLPDGRIQRLDPVDRICDSRQESFDLARDWPVSGKMTSQWQIRVEVRDLAGNLAVAEGELVLDPGRN